MSTHNLLHSTRRWLLTLVIAAILAVTAAYSPMLIDQTAGTNLTNAVYACGPSGGGC